MMIKLEFSPQTVRPSHQEKASDEEPADLKKLVAKLAQVKEENPQTEVKLWVENEARFGLQSILRRVWAKRGKRPIAKVKPGYEWFWSYGAIKPKI